VRQDNTKDTTSSLAPKQINPQQSSIMLKPEQENEIDFRREDQININRFARLNSRLHDVRDDRDLFKVSPRIVVPYE